MTHSALTKYLELGSERNQHTRRRDRFSTDWQTAGLSEKTPSDCPLDLNGEFPWCDDRFEIVYASHVMEHLAAPRFFLKNCLRVLKPGGVIRIAVPSMRWVIGRYMDGKCSLDGVLDWARSFSPNKHRDGYDEPKLRGILIDVGFEDVSILRPGKSRVEIMRDSYFSNRAERTIRCEGMKPTK